MSLLIPNSDVKLPLNALSTSTSVLCKDSESEAVFRNSYCPDRLVSCLTSNLTTYHELFSDAARKFSNRPCLTYRKFDFTTNTRDDSTSTISYSAVNDLRKQIGSGILAALADIDPNLVSLHLKQYRDYNRDLSSPIISIFSGNRYEWTLCDIACQSYSLTNTALYDNLGDNVTLHILSQTDSPVVFCSGDKVEKVHKLAVDNDLQVRVVVSFDPVMSHVRKRFEADGLRLLTLEELATLGKNSPIDFCAPTPDTLFTISFTSGTTGANPKGVLLNHRNAVSALTFLLSSVPQIQNGRALIFLPLTHIYERQTSSFALMAGYNLGYPDLVQPGTVVDQFTFLVENLKWFKPHYFSIVPRLLTKLESYIKSYAATQADSEKLRTIIQDRIQQQGTDDFEEGDAIHYEPYRKLRSLLGADNLVWLQTASAPVNKLTLIYIKAALGIGLSQLYGLTETFGAVTRSLPHEAEPGSCGAVSMTAEVKLSLRADMDTYDSRGVGELMIRGPQVCVGYFKNAEETAKAFDHTGWFRTGDVARIDEGKIYIVDRVKNFFKLAHGEFISPERIENIYLSNNPILQQLFVYGHPSRAFVVGIAGISPEGGLQLLAKTFGTVEKMLEALNSTESKRQILKQLNSKVLPHLNGMERMGNIHFEVNPLTVERNVVTPTMKIKRAVAARFFDGTIARLYDTEGHLVRGEKL